MPAKKEEVKEQPVAKATSSAALRRKSGDKKQLDKSTTSVKSAATAKKPA